MQKSKYINVHAPPINYAIIGMWYYILHSRDDVKSRLHHPIFLKLFIVQNSNPYTAEKTKY